MPEPGEPIDIDPQPIDPVDYFTVHHFILDPDGDCPLPILLDRLETCLTSDCQYLDQDILESHYCTRSHGKPCKQRAAWLKRLLTGDCKHWA